MFDLSQIRESIRYEGGVSRRLFLAYGAALSALPIVGAQAIGRTLKHARFSANPFSVGVASGEPRPTGFVIWTRLAPNPLESGGMTDDVVEVRWEVAEDDAFTKIVKSGVALATPQLAHSVHVEVDGLAADCWYFYRFHAADATSPVGRSRTMPEAEKLADKLKFSFVSCQHYEQGLYTGYEAMAGEDLDLVVHLGDYIYEGPTNKKAIRQHVGGKLLTLADYRNRHAQYKTDPLLAAMHARCPWIVTWDDHEVENNWAAGISERKNVDPAAFLEQRANAFQAYYEMMPLRSASVPRGPDMKLYRTISFGRLATFQVLDTRQYRTDQPNNARHSDLTQDALNPKNSLLGGRQAGWLKAQLLKSTARWNVLAQQVMMGMVDTAGGEDIRYSMDQWCSAAHERMKLVEFMAQRKIPNPVVLTGDIHSSWANELRVDDRKADTPIIAAEFVGSSIASSGNGPKEVKGLDALLAENPCVKFHDRQRAYVTCTVTPEKWQSDFRVIDEVLKPGGKVTTKQSLVVEAGQPAIKPA